MLYSYFRSQSNVYMIGLFITTYTLFQTQPVLADKWQLTPTVTLEERYDDNIRLTTAPHDSVTGTLITGRLNFSKLSEVNDIVGEILGNFSEYTGDEVRDNNKNNYSLRLTSDYRTEVNRFGVTGIIRRDTSLRFIEADTAADDSGTPIIDDPITEPDIDSDVDLDKGLVDIEVERQTLFISPYFRHNLNERSSLDLTYEFIEASYNDNPSGSGVFDYTSQNISSRYTYRLTDRDELAFAAEVGRFESPDNANNTVDTYSLTASYRRDFNETLSGNLLVGFTHAEQDSDVFSSDNDGAIFEFELSKRTETDRYFITVARSLQPSGIGSLSETDQVRIGAKRRFTQRLSTVIDLRFANSERLRGGTVNDDKYLSITPRVNWNMTRYWTLSGGYRYREIEKSSGGTAESNAVFISIRYNEPYIFD